MDREVMKSISAKTAGCPYAEKCVEKRKPKQACQSGTNKDT